MKYVKRKIFYGSIIRFGIFLILVSVVPLVFLFLLTSDRWDQITNIFIVVSFAFVLAVSCFYAVSHYFGMNKALKPVTHLVEIGKVAAEVAHDLRSPLTSVQTALNYFHKTEAKTDEFTNHLNLLSFGSKRLEKIIQDLLNKHKGVVEVEEIFELHNVLDELVTEYSLQPALSKIHFEKLYADPSMTLKGHREKIQRTFGNLMKNAIEAMEFDGTLTITTEIQGEKVLVNIQDTGPGISPEKMEKILKGEGFTQGKRDGNGIGLPFVRDVIAKHNGEMKLESKLGEGTTFQIELPLEQSKKENLRCQEYTPSTLDGAPTRPSARLRAGLSADNNEGYTVLVIDDDELIRVTWKIMSTRLPVSELYCFSSLEKLQEEKIDLSRIDIAFVDKNIEGSQFKSAEVIEYLKMRQVSRVVIASGESEEDLRKDPALSKADFFSSRKIPNSFKEFFS